MMHFVSRLFGRVRRWLGFEVGAPPPINETAELPIPDQSIEAESEAAIVEPIAVKAKKKAGDDAQLDADFRLKTDVLDQLDHYMRYIKRMKLVDRESYLTFGRLGIPLVPLSFGILRKEVDSDVVPPWFRQALPSFGGAVFSLGKAMEAEEDKEGMVYPRFIYYRKYTPHGAPKVLQPASNASSGVFLCTIFFDRLGDKKMKTPVLVDYAISIEADGAIRPLRFRRQKQIVLPRKNKRREPPRVLPTTQVWDWPQAVIDIAGDHKMSCEKWLTQAFMIMALNCEMNTLSMVRVTAKRDGLTAVFGVDVTKSARFFDDRQDVVVDGRKKRIFHIVKAHGRQGAAGATSYVRLHFRGLRRFLWNGFEIDITVPGKDHIDFRDLDLGAIDQEATGGKRPEGFITDGQLAKKVASRMTSPTLH